jgi:hypothetical protein
LRSAVWEKELENYPDQVFASSVVDGMKHGLRVGFDHLKTLRSCTGNMAPALQHPDVVSDYLKQEVLLNRMVVVPPAQAPYIHCHISQFGVIPVVALAPAGMHLMRCLTFITAKYNFVVSAAHNNDLADALSRNSTLSHYPQAEATPTVVPPELVELIVTSQPEWISLHWTRLWTTIFGQH